MAAPTIDSSVPFPDPLTLFRRSGRFESDAFTAGAKVHIETSGTAVMRFEPGAGFSFDQTPQMTKAGVNVGEQHTLTMTRSLSTTQSGVSSTRLVVVVLMQGEATEEEVPQVVAVKYATAFENFRQRIRRLWRMR